MAAASTAKAWPIRLGVIANEFFDRALGRMGSFGWAAA
jgi:hypothetical protein